jgi:hypothetical protein
MRLGSRTAAGRTRSTRETVVSVDSVEVAADQEGTQPGSARHSASAYLRMRGRSVCPVANGRVDPVTRAALEQVFHFRYDVKRLALGRTDRWLGTLAADAEPA